GTPFLTGESPLSGTIPARGQRTVTLPARIRFDELLQTLNRIRPGQTVPYDAQLGLTVGTPVHENGMRLPIATAGEFPIPDIPRISVDSVAFSELNLSQAVATLRLKVTNTNQFPVALDQMLTNLSLNGRTLATTDLGRAIQFEPNGTQVVELPITFSPLDAGVGLFDALRQSGTKYQTDGTLTLQTPFGPITMKY
ncbi:MAG: LEA type 2 family protein, partial [Phycisphaerales bacterium]|nr:LEA type 2 family protein [Phycisphaerales bacterium]